MGRGLSPVNQLRTRLARLRDGAAAKLEGDYPSEVQPLVDDLNALLAQRAQAVVRAQAKAGDLAHGLKTPLAVLANEAQRARDAGHEELAAAVDQQVARMQRQVDYHLAQARAAASGPSSAARAEVGESADGLIRALRRLYADRPLAIAACVPAGTAVRAQRVDLDEMLGNLLDNACKWAAAEVRIHASRSDGVVVVHLDDDGPGLAAPLRAVGAAARCPRRRDRTGVGPRAGDRPRPRRALRRGDRAGRVAAAGPARDPHAAGGVSDRPGRATRGDFGEPAYTGKGSGMFVSVLMILFCVSSWEAALAQSFEQRFPEPYRQAIDTYRAGRTAEAVDSVLALERAPTRACTVCCRSLAGGFAMPPARTPSSRPRRCSMWMRAALLEESKDKDARSQFGLARQFVDLSVPSARSAGSLSPPVVSCDLTDP